MHWKKETEKALTWKNDRQRSKMNYILNSNTKTLVLLFTNLVSAVFNYFVYSMFNYVIVIAVFGAKYETLLKVIIFGLGHFVPICMFLYVKVLCRKTFIFRNLGGLSSL
jgi:hypothetical protein